MRQVFRVVKAVFSCVAFFVFVAVQYGQVMAQSVIPYTDIPNSKYIETFGGFIDDKFVTVYEFDADNRILYRCVGMKDQKVGAFRCSKAKPPKKVLVPDDIVKKWKLLTGGEFVSGNNFTILPLTSFPEPYQQRVWSLILLNRSANKIWVCTYVKNDYEFTADIDGKTAYFFSSKQPEIHEFCRLKYPSRM